MIREEAVLSKDRLEVMLFLGLSTSLLLLNYAACADPEPKETRLASANNDLAFELLRSSKDAKNVFISPFSISTALALVYLGSDGTTSQVMRKVLKYDHHELSEQDINESFQSVCSRLKSNIKNYEFTSFNHVLVQKNITVLHEYEKALQEYYSADIESVDFATNGNDIKSKVNAVVENVTRGKIENFLEQPPSVDTKLFLLNAVYFLGNWENPFSPNFTYYRTFYNNGVEEKKVQMMHRDAVYRYAAMDDISASLLVLPYKGSENESTSMVIIRPNERNEVSEVAKKITHEVLDKALGSATERRVQLILPKFSLKYKTDLVDTLTTLGLGELFSTSANLTKMVNADNLGVGSVAHEAAIDVNERGSEAAAATGIEIIPLSVPPLFDVIHPFLFFIRDNLSGMILFSGRVDQL